MSTTIIITLSVLLLLAYLFDITASKTKIPAVILLLLLGFLLKQASLQLGISIPDMSSLLPVLGTVGLILIVLEGSLELEVNRKKLPLIFHSSVIALLPILLISFGLAWYLNEFLLIPRKMAMVNAIPLAVISSAIAIPSAKNLLKPDREFITYESSLSDIFGVILFNFIALNDSFGFQTIGQFVFELFLMLVISLVSTLLLAGFLHKIKHHIKFVPLVIMVVLIYVISKIFHLPALIFILIFGLLLGNIDELKHLKWVQQFHPINFSKEVHKFREITTELAFLIRALFFILFGFLIEAADVLNTKTMLLALAITGGIFLLRYLLLKMFRISSNPLVFIAPRGLITILLFLSVPLEMQIDVIDKSLIIQVIVLSALVMMSGLMFYRKPKNQPVNESKPTV